MPASLFFHTSEDLVYVRWTLFWATYFFSHTSEDLVYLERALF